MPEGIPVFGMSYGQQRKIKAGRDFTISEYKRIRRELEKLLGVVITDEKVEAAFGVYEDYRAAMRRFEREAARHPEIVSSLERMMIIKAGLFMDKALYTEKIEQINQGLSEEPEGTFDGKRVVITGIMAEPPEILKIFDESGLAVVADEMSLGSRLWRAEARNDVENIYERMAYRYADTEADTFMYEHESAYITICTDVFSSAFAPGVSAPQALGLDPERVLPVIKHILRTRKIRGFDICEISPRFDQDNTTASLGAVLIFTVVNTICKLKNLAVNTGVEYYG